MKEVLKRLVALPLFIIAWTTMGIGVLIMDNNARREMFTNMGDSKEELSPSSKAFTIIFTVASWIGVIAIALKQ